MIKLPVHFVPVIFCVVFTLLLLSCQPGKHKILVGTYTAGESEGIYLCSFDENREVLSLDGLVANVTDPSFLTVTERGDHVYAVSETWGGSVLSFTWDGTQLVQNGSKPAKGDHPCYIDINSDQSLIAVANYSSGNFSVIKSMEDGSLQGDPVSWQHTGKGTDTTRQKGPHAHCAKWVGNKALLIVDLGIDYIIPYTVDDDLKITKVNEGIKMKEGCGPRHIVLHPFRNIVYATCELSNEVAVMEFDPQSLELTAIQYISTLPRGFSGSNTNADLHITPGGKYLYASNRGHDSLAAFRITGTGQLESVGHFPVRGEKPRNFTILPGGKHLLVANQDSDNIVAFRINSTDGSLEFTGSEIEVPSPVCLKSFR